MKRSSLITLGVVLLMLAVQNPAGGEIIEGVVTELKPWQNTFQISPMESRDVTEENVFLVRPDTKLKGFSWLRDLDIGDRILVTGEPMNEVVWKAYTMEKKV